MIITSVNIRAVRPIAENVDDAKRLEPYIEECTNLYFIPAIGAAKFKEIEDDMSQFKLLLDGGYYDEDKKHFAGLNQAMGYLVYSRIVRNNQVNTTAFGVVLKQGQFSEQADEETIIRISNDAEKIGMKYLQECVDYLNFSADKSCVKNTFKSKRIKAIGD